MRDARQDAQRLMPRVRRDVVAAFRRRPLIACSAEALEKLKLLELGALFREHNDVVFRNNVYIKKRDVEQHLELDGTSITSRSLFRDPLMKQKRGRYFEDCGTMRWRNVFYCSGVGSRRPPL